MHKCDCHSLTCETVICGIGVEETLKKNETLHNFLYVSINTNFDFIKYFKSLKMHLSKQNIGIKHILQFSNFVYRSFHYCIMDISSHLVYILALCSLFLFLKNCDSVAVTGKEFVIREPYTFKIIDFCVVRKLD